MKSIERLSCIGFGSISMTHSTIQENLRYLKIIWAQNLIWHEGKLDTSFLSDQREQWNIPTGIPCQCMLLNYLIWWRACPNILKNWIWENIHICRIFHLISIILETIMKEVNLWFGHGGNLMLNEEIFLI